MEKETTNHLTKAGIKNFHDMEYKFGEKMFSRCFINSFLNLVVHDAHKIKVPYHPEGVVFKAVTTASGIPPRVKDLEEIVTNIVSIAFSASHFVVLNIDIKKHYVTVMDGLNYCIKQWKNHVMYTLKEYKLVPMDAVPILDYECNKKRKMMMKITFLNSELELSMENIVVEKQTDGISCGPLACFCMLLLFGYEKLLCKSMITDYKQMRVKVMEHWSAMLQRNKSDIYSLVHSSKYTKLVEVIEALTPQTKTTDKDSKLITESEQVAEKLEETAVLAEVKELVSDDHAANQEASMAKRNARQEQLAKKAMKQYEEGVKKLGVATGAIVTLKVDN